MIFSSLQNFHKCVQTITVKKIVFLRFFQVIVYGDKTGYPWTKDC